MVVQWLSQPRLTGFDAQPLHSFLVLFHLIKVVRLKLLVEEEGSHRVDVEIRYPISSHFVLKLIPGITYLVSAGFQTNLRTEQVQTVTKFEDKIYIHFFTRRRLWGRRRQCLSFLLASV